VLTSADCLYTLGYVNTDLANRMTQHGKNTKAIAYMRTSSASNVGADKDSDKRQRAAIAAFAKSARYELVDEFYDAAVSGADPIESRPGFSALLDRIEGNGVRVVLVEDASRFARDLITQELGILVLIKRDVRVITASGDDLTDSSDPARKMMRQVAGAFSEYEKARLVAKLKGARDRIRAKGIKCGGAPSHMELRPDVVALAKDLRRKRGKMPQRSLRQISAELAARGHLNGKDRPFSAVSVSKMLAVPASAIKERPASDAKELALVLTLGDGDAS
jgi:DNA invertase Pin-like site-specific DNA recombinase